MTIGFRTKKLQKACSQQKEGVKAYGAECARKLRARLADLSAAPSLEAMRGLPGRTHELKGERQGELAIDLKHPFRLVFVPDHDPVPETEDGGLDWAQVTDIEVIAIEDYH